MSPIWTVVQLILLFTVNAYANVSITTSGNHADGNQVECRSEVTLICTAPANTDNMIWRRNGVQIADCSVGFCDGGSAFKTLYTFVFDTVRGNFNITIPKVSTNESNANFTCDILSDAISITIHVIGDYSVYAQNNTVELKNATELTISTGCIENITSAEFQWMLVNALNSSHIRQLPSSVEVKHSTSSCLLDHECGGDGKIKQISTISIIEDDNTVDSYFIKISVSYNGLEEHDRDHQFYGRAFKIKDNDAARTKKTLTTGEIVAIVVGIIAFVVILIVIVVIFVLKKKKKSEGLGNDSKK